MRGLEAAFRAGAAPRQRGLQSSGGLGAPPAPTSFCTIPQLTRRQAPIPQTGDLFFFFNF